MGLLNTIINGSSQHELLNYGEVFGIWQHLMQAKGCLTKYQLLKNHTSDKELRQFLTEMTEDVIQPEIPALEEILKHNGILPPPSRPEKPEADPERIPVGARFTEQEIAMCVQHDLMMAITSCTQIITTSTRKDIGRTFAMHQAEVMLKGDKLLELMKDKGWVVMPPLHTDVP